MRHLTKRERKGLQSFDGSLQTDWPRRLCNALKALISLDCHWLYWVECAIDCQHMDIATVTRIIEWRAHALLFKRYSYFGYRQEIGFLIFRDWPFNDRGNLSPG